MQTIWTSERVDELRRLAALEQLSAAEIARTLSCADITITKNMVIGRCWRTGVKLMPDARKLTRAHAHRMRNSFPSSHKSCLWPHGHPDDPQFHFCGGDPLPGKPYCAVHAARAYVRANGEAV